MNKDGASDLDEFFKSVKVPLKESSEDFDPEPQSVDEIISNIAMDQFDIESFAPTNTDDDFVEVSLESLKTALKKAFEYGQNF